MKKATPRLIIVFLISISVVFAAQAQVIWQLGSPGRGWPQGGIGGGPDVNFVQESGASNPPPGDPNSPAVNQQADDDYYFTGTYPTPIGFVADDEIAMERAFAGIDNDLRIHFNLPAWIQPADLFTFSFEANNLNEDPVNFDPRYGIEVSANGVLVMPEFVVRPGDLYTIITSSQFTLADVGWQTGPGVDNVLSLRGINYNADGGGNWMGLDYHHLSVHQTSIPEPSSVPEPSSAVVFTVVSAIALLPGLIRRVRRRFVNSK